uniref:Uncharacterized protein n=1 Tax=Photinus pyralis TaxID=7054 RepID=A0A1Y1LPW6_PHOPY
MDLAKHIKPLAGETDWPILKRKMRDLLDYHEGALDVIDGNLCKPETLSDNEQDERVKANHKKASGLFRKANSYAKSMIYDAWEALKLNFEASSKDQLFKICTEFFAFSWIK